MKYILKHIWINRGKNSWVFAEMVIITVLSWLFGNALILSTYNDYFFEKEMSQRMDMVYKIDQVYTSTNSYMSSSAEETYNRQEAFADILRNMPEVASASIYNSFWEFEHHVSYTYKLTPPSDTNIVVRAGVRGIRPNDNLFKTLDIRLTNGTESADEVFDNMEDDEVMITKSLAMALYETENAEGKTITETHNDWDSKNQVSREIVKLLKVKGVTTDILPGRGERYAYTYFTKDSAYKSWNPVVRLKEGIDAEAFMSKVNEAHHTVGDWELMIGTKYLDSPDKNQNNMEVMDESRTVFITLFLLNVFIGTIGTFWIQIRKRKEDIGIMRSFGATRWGIVRMLITEGIVLGVIANILGDIIVLNIMGDNLGGVRGIMCFRGDEQDWATMYWPFFMIVSTIICIVTSIVTSIAIAIPAIHLTRKSPTEALKEN